LCGGLSHETLRKQITTSHGQSFQILEQRPPRHAGRTECFVRSFLSCDPDLFTDGRLPLFYPGLPIRIVRPLNGLPVFPRLALLKPPTNARLLPGLSRIS
jgi:hypothetical protein